MPNQEMAESGLWTSSQERGSKEASLDPCVYSEADELANKNHRTTNHNDFWSVLVNV